MKFEAKPGVQCLFNNRVVVVDGYESLTQVRVREQSTGVPLVADVANLRALPKSAMKFEIGNQSDEEWDRCYRVAQQLAQWKEGERVSKPDLIRASKRLGVSVRTLQRYRARFAVDPRVSALARNGGGRVAGFNALDAKVHDVVLHSIDKYYLRRERPSQQHVVDRVKAICFRIGLPAPSRNAIARRIKRIAGLPADTRRFGRKAAQHRWKARPGSLNAEGPLSVVQIDHTKVDVIVLSDDRETILGRPWVTLAIDVYTRCVVGFHLTMHAPNCTSVSMCIEHMVLPKPENLERPDYWPMHGLPKEIRVDNGKDLRSEALKRGCDQHLIELSWRPVRTPHYGGHIERLNGTLMKMCHLLPGTTFSNPKQRGDYLSEKEAKFTLGELRAWLTEKICRYYHVREHSGIGVPPLVKWKQAFTDPAGQPIPPKTAADPNSFRIDFLPFAMRQVHIYGFSLFGSRYWHEDLAELIRTDPVLIKYDPRAKQSAWVRMPDGALLEVPAVAGPATGMTPEKLKIDEETQACINEAFAAHFERCDEIENGARKATRRAKKKGSTPASADTTDNASASSDPPPR